LFERNIFVLKWYFVTIQDFCPKTDFCLNTIGRYFCPQNVFLFQQKIFVRKLIFVWRFDYCWKARILFEPTRVWSSLSTVEFVKIIRLKLSG
jgi:hypothetical protein